jgi:hypothetical protein
MRSLNRPKPLGVITAKITATKGCIFKRCVFCPGGQLRQCGMKNFLAKSEKGKLTLEDYNGEIKNMAANLFNVYGDGRIAESNQHGFGGDGNKRWTFEDIKK